MSDRTDPLWLDSLSENPQSVHERGADHNVRIEDGVALVPTSQCMSLTLPYVPQSRSEVVALIGQAAPLRARQLAWTQPVAEEHQGLRILLARRDWLDRYIEDAAKHGVEAERVYSEEHRLPFDYRTPVQRRRGVITGGFWIGAALASIAALWSLQERTVTGSARPPTENLASSALEPFLYSSLNADILSVSQLASSDIDLSRIERSRDGSLVLEMRTIEPDGMRETIAQEGILPNFREAGQSVGTGQEYLIAYRRKAIDAVPTSTKTDLLKARGLAQASARVRELLESYAQSEVVQLNLAAPTQDQAGSLTFSFELVGRQNDVLGMTERIESTAPPMRFAEWSLSPAPEGVHLSGLLYVPWHLTSS